MGTWCNARAAVRLTKIKGDRASGRNRKMLRDGPDRRREAPARAFRGPTRHCQRRTYVRPTKVTFCVGLRTIVVPSE